jgi:hypothetical protein
LFGHEVRADAAKQPKVVFAQLAFVQLKKATNKSSNTKAIRKVLEKRKGENKNRSPRNKSSGAKYTRR